MVCRNRTFSRSVDGVPLSESNSARNTEDISQEDYLPFFLDDDSSGPEGSPSFSKRRPSMKSTYGFSLDTQVDGKEAKSNALNNMDFTPRHSSTRRNLETPSFKPDINKFSNEHLHEASKYMNQRSMNVQSRGTNNPNMCFSLQLMCFSLSYFFLWVVLVQLWTHWS